jgi:hypothetical protein
MDHEKSFARSKDQFDSAQPAGNSVAARNLVRLWKKTGDEGYRAYAERTFRAFAGALKSNPSGLTAMAEALALYLEEQGAGVPAGPAAGEGAAQAGGPKKSDAVVRVAATADKPDAEGKQVVTVTLTIDKGWHTYANPPGLEDLAPVQTTVTVTAKTKPEDVKVDYPKGKEINDKVLGKYLVYEDRVSIKAAVRRAKGDTSPLEVSVRFQSCDDKMCLLPATVKLTVP